MKRLFLFISLLTSIFIAKAQEIQTMWVNDNFIPVSESHATYKKVFSIHDSVLTIDLISLKDKTQYVEHYCNGRPVGKWQEINNRTVIAERDFDNISYIGHAVDTINTLQLSADSAFDVPPSFLGGDKSRLRFLWDNIQYPYIAMQHGLQGTTYLKFTVTKEGSIDSVAILKSSNPYLDYEAVRVVRVMPKWNPGKKDGKPVNVRFNMPVKFTHGGLIDNAQDIQELYSVKQSEHFGQTESIAYNANAQKVQELYFDKNLEPLSQPKGAAYKKTITIEDSLTTIVLTGIKEKTTQIEYYKNDKPVGMWLYLEQGQVIEQCDFDYINRLANEKLDRPDEQVIKGSLDSSGVNRPLFVGGEKARIEFLQQNIQYPLLARLNGIQGTVHVSFIVTKEGEIKRPTIIKSAHPFLDFEAIRLIKSMPKWTPGTKNGQPVDVRFNMPIKFNLG